MKVTNIQEILESIGKDILTDDVKEKISGCFNEAVEASVKAKVELVVENELQKLDTEHTEKLAKLLETIDNDHTSKMKMIVEKLDVNYAGKLQKVATKYEKELKEGADTLRTYLVDQTSKYLDRYLQESIPREHLKEAVENTRARKMVDQIKQIVAVDEEFVNENFKDALKDGHDIIETLRGELSKVMKESVNSKQELIKAQSTLILEQETKDLPAGKKKYVYKLLEGKKPEEIKENLSFVLEMYEKDEAEATEKHVKNLKSPTRTLSEKIDVPKIITENVEDSAEFGENTSHYLEGFDEIK